MRFFLTIALGFLLNCSYSQVIVNGININEKEDVVFCQVVGTQKFLSNKVIIAIDYGQERKIFSAKNIVKDGEGRNKVFNSMIDALNFMANNGWIYIDAYTLTVGNSNVYHYTFEKGRD